MKRSLHILLALFVASFDAWAGAVPGPYVIWVNLSMHPGPVDRTVENYLESDDDLCWNKGALMFMRSKPSGVTPALVRRAVLEKDVGALRKLSAILRRPFGEANQGFDGLIAYSELPEPTYYGLTTGRNRIQSVQPLPDFLGRTICVVMPEVVRKP